MILMRSCFEYLGGTTNPLRTIERCGRICYDSNSEYSLESAKEFCRMIIKRGHESVLEHASVSVLIVCDRGVSHEWVRHRIGVAISQRSTRYCDERDNEIAFILPEWVRGFEEGLYDSERLCSFLLDIADDPNMDEASSGWFFAMVHAESDYKHLREDGWSPEQARSVLPNSLMTKIAFTANIREWRHFFRLRADKAAHPQMREITIPLLKMFKENYSPLFDDIHPDILED